MIESDDITNDSLPDIDSDIMSSGKEFRDKEKNLLERQVYFCQAAIMDENPRKFIGAVEMLEAMLDEYIKPDDNYDPTEITNVVRAAYSLKPSEASTTAARSDIALAKFKRLYVIFKKSHLPVNVEARL